MGGRIVASASERLAGLAPRGYDLLAFSTPHPLPLLRCIPTIDATNAGMRSHRRSSC